MGRPITGAFNGKNQVLRGGSTAGGVGGTGGGGAGGTSASQESVKAELEMYLKEVRELFHDREEKYDLFHRVVKDFMDQRTDVVSVIAQVKELLKGQKNLIYEFNAFLPNGFEITPDEDTPPPEVPVESVSAISFVNTPSPEMSVAFVSAIDYVNKLKVRFQDEEHVYRSFIDILNRYREKKCDMNEVYTKVAYLFKDHPDLFEEFDSFLPDT